MRAVPDDIRYRGDRSLLEKYRKAAREGAPRSRAPRSRALPDPARLIATVADILDYDSLLRRLGGAKERIAELGEVKERFSYSVPFAPEGNDLHAYDRAQSEMRISAETAEVAFTMRLLERHGERLEPASLREPAGYPYYVTTRRARLPGIDLVNDPALKLAGDLGSWGGGLVLVPPVGVADMIGPQEVYGVRTQLDAEVPWTYAAEWAAVPPNDDDSSWRFAVNIGVTW